MPSSSIQDYPDLKAPREDGAVIVWPEPGQLLSHTLANQRRLRDESTVRVQNIPLNELRRNLRRWLGFDDAQPLLADGHQTELHHSGVWVKRIATQAAAGRLDGRAVHFAVDTDAPKHLDLRWPGASIPITDDPRRSSAHWTGLLGAPTPAHIEHLDEALRASSFSTSPAEVMFIPSLRRQALESPGLSSALTRAMHELDWSLGLRHHAMLVSPIWQSEAFAIFAHHVIARAGGFAADYNAALTDYRRRKKIRTPNHPMPDLTVSSASVELPFWLDRLDTGDRMRPHALARGGQFALSAPGGEEFFFDPTRDGFDSAGALGGWLKRNHLRLSPRALTLTLFLRLCCVDQFVHGIGGAQYDQVTDRLIAAHFHLDPPGFAIVTGTMYPPASLERARVCLPCLAQEGHRLRHGLLGESKRQRVEQIAAAPRKSARRYELFADLHRHLASAATTDPRMRQWEQKLQEAQSRAREEASLFDRELFYALQPLPRLEMMVDKVRGCMSHDS